MHRCRFSELGLVALVVTGCAQNRWVPDSQVQSICPREVWNPIKPPRRPSLGLVDGAITGRVLWPDSSRPIYQAIAMLGVARPMVGRTDLTGNFRIDSVTLGTYPLMIRALGFKPRYDTVEVVPGPAPAYKVRLKPDFLDAGPCSGFYKVRLRWTGR